MSKKIINFRGMRTVTAVLLVLAMLFTFAGCGNKAEDVPAPSTPPAAPAVDVTVSAEAPEDTTPPITEPPVVTYSTLMPYPVEEGMTEANPELQAFNTPVLRKDVCTIFFQDTLADAPADAVDASAAQDGSVKAWVEHSDELYDLYIAAEGGVYAPEDASFLFAGMENLDGIDFGGAFFTDNTTSMRGMFQDSSVKNLDLTCFNTGKVTDMSHMFDDCDAVVLNISSFDTSNVTDMSYMFCSSELTSLDVSNFDTSNVTNMASMFGHITFLKELDVTNFNTSNVTNMSSMFSGCVMLTAVDVSSFDTSKVTDMMMMFSGSGFTTLDISNFDTSNVTDFMLMFGALTKIEELNLGKMETENAQFIGGFIDGPEEAWRYLFPEAVTG